ncbi:MAG: aldehyde dehydrogenase family protein, partial [Planctomycetota bacterium]|nr:aldehyde dehydrogenase family protein [Planctomycetota bacterium]
MAARLDVQKTYKLYIGGQFPRTESGRSTKALTADGKLLAHTCHASRKDLRNAIVVARQAAAGWAGRTAYNRGQILYRMSEMMEGKAEEFAATIKASTGDSIRAARREVEASIDRLVAFAG